jgi:hypothetical protein
MSAASISAAHRTLTVAGIDSLTYADRAVAALQGDLAASPVVPRSTS